MQKAEKRASAGAPLPCQLAHERLRTPLLVVVVRVVDQVEDVVHLARADTCPPLSVLASSIIKEGEHHAQKLPIYWNSYFLQSCLHNSYCVSASLPREGEMGAKNKCA